VLLLVLLIPLAAFWYLTTTEPPKITLPGASNGTLSETFDPRSLFQDDSSSFLPPPVAALPAERDAGPPAPAVSDPAQSAPVENVKVANTGGLGAVLRANPPKGPQVAALRDGQLLQVIEHQDVSGEDWVHVKTQDGVEGWIYGRLIGPAN
jgi:hypothetical protein